MQSPHLSQFARIRAQWHAEVERGTNILSELSSTILQLSFIYSDEGIPGSLEVRRHEVGESSSDFLERLDHFPRCKNASEAS